MGVFGCLFVCSCFNIHAHFPDHYGVEGTDPGFSLGGGGGGAQKIM